MSDEGRTRNVPSRIFHAGIAFALLCALVFYVASVAKFAPKYRDISENSIYGKKEHLRGSCVLFAKVRSTEKGEVPDLGPGSVCQYAIGGGAAAGFIALVLCVVSVAKTIVGIPM